LRRRLRAEPWYGNLKEDNKEEPDVDDNIKVDVRETGW
jgi:hypothetical protein